MKKCLFLQIMVICVSLMMNDCGSSSSGGSSNGNSGGGGASDIPISAETAKNVILALTCVAENDTVTFVYNYAENINDGRGITFGIIGFTSGTFDGTILLKRIKTKDSGHPLCAYIPAFEKIDSLHEDGHISDVTGLDDFIVDFTKYGNDEVVKESQLELMDEMYWQPAVKIADKAGLKYNITRGQIYDSCVKHGESGAEKIVERTNAVVGSPANGADEIEWLKRYFIERKKYYDETGEGEASIPRIDVMYQGIFDSKNYMLVPPFGVKCYDDKVHTITGEHP